MEYKEVAESLCNKFHTRDPFEIARQLRVKIFYEHLGTIRGYYNKQYKQKMIHINSELDIQESKIVCAHELGHAILHPNANTPFLRAHTLYSINKYELQANKFASNLIWSDDELREYQDCSIEQIAHALGIGQALAEYRMLTVLPKILGV